MPIKQLKPGQIGEYWLSKKPGRSRAADAWCRTWYDKHTRQTRRVSVGTSDFQEASRELARWFTLNDRPSNARPDGVLMDKVLLTYWEDHGKKVAAASSLRRELGLWQEFWAEKTVAEITSNTQKQFREWLGEGRIKASTIDKILAAGRAALKRAVKHGELASAPHIFMTETSGEKISRPPMGTPLNPEEIARILDAVTQPHLLVYLIIAANTLARPEAIFDLRRNQFDESADRLNLNPQGRIQTKKFRPIIPVTPTLKPWLERETNSDAHYVQYKGHPIKKIPGAWTTTIRNAGLTGRINRYSFRHGMARQIRMRGIALEELGTFMGHKHRGASSTTAIYAPDDPKHLSAVSDAIEDVMKEVRKHMRTDRLGDPKSAMADMARSRGQGKHLTDTKRDELRSLLRRGYPSTELAHKFGISLGAIYKHKRRIGL